MNGLEQTNPSSGLVGTIQISTTERLQNEEVQLKKRLADVEEALKILKANPDIERLLTIIGGRIY